MVEPITEGIQRFADGEITLFGNPYDAFPAVNGRNSPLEDKHYRLSAFCVYLAINSFNVAIDSYGSAVTEGYQERGFDGIAISINDLALTGEAQAEAVCQALVSDYLQRIEEGEEISPPRVKILMVQVKSKDHAEVKELDYLGNSAEKFFTTPNFPDEFRANDAVSRWWKIYQTVKTVHATNNVNFCPKIDMLFVYMGKHLEEKPLNQKSSDYCRESLAKHLSGNAEVSYTLWRQKEVVDAIALADQALDGTLKNVSLLPLPKATTASGYIGFCPASSIASMIPIIHAPGQNDSRPDDRAFSDNVRSFRGLKKNPGAAGLRNSLIDGEGDQVILRHNGITIVTRGLKEDNYTGNLYNLDLQGYQIVNGAQSSFVLQQHIDLLEDVHIPIKIVITESQPVKDGVVRGANSQLNVSDFDMLARYPEIRALQQAFNVIDSDRPDKLWFKRLGGERFHSRPKRIQVVTPRQLLEAYVAAIEAAPHSVHAGSAKLLLKVPKQVFRRDHHPSVYRALGWLLVTARAWAKQNRVLWIDDVASNTLENSKQSGTKDKYGARHQFIYALWQLVDPNPNDIDYLQGKLSHKSNAVENRFEHTCQLLSDSEIAMQYANKAASAINEALESSGSVSSQVRLKPFTEKVRIVVQTKRV